MPRSIARRWRSSSSCSGAGPSSQSDAFLPYRIAFDVEKLTWELDFFVEAFRRRLPGRGDVTPAERTALDEEWRSIVDELAAEPRVLCHRDYHSRNLMLHDGRLYIIDFQDARMGPDTYDLVSLLRDSYVDITDARARRAHRLLPGAEAGDGADSSSEAYPAPVRPDGAAAQPEGARHLRLPDRTRRNPVYIQYIPRTLRYARANLHKYPRFARLRELLAAHVEELGNLE